MNRIMVPTFDAWFIFIFQHAGYPPCINPYVGFLKWGYPDLSSTSRWDCPLFLRIITPYDYGTPPIYIHVLTIYHPYMNHLADPPWLWKPPHIPPGWGARRCGPGSSRRTAASGWAPAKLLHDFWIRNGGFHKRRYNGSQWWIWYHINMVNNWKLWFIV